MAKLGGSQGEYPLGMFLIYKPLRLLLRPNARETVLLIIISVNCIGEGGGGKHYKLGMENPWVSSLY